jgi:HrpA-like RNA helicase
MSTDVSSDDDAMTEAANGFGGSGAASFPLTRWRRVTSHGRRLSALPLHPRLAHMVATAVDLDWNSRREASDGSGGGISSAEGGVGRSSSLAAEACSLAALLQERDPLPRGTGADLRRRIETLRDYKQEATAATRKGARSNTDADGDDGGDDGSGSSGSFGGASGARLSTVAAAEAQLLSALKAVKPNPFAPAAGQGLALRAAAADASASAAAAAAYQPVSSSASSSSAVMGDCTGALLALAYPDRVARRRVASTGLRSGGGGQRVGGGPKAKVGGGGGGRFTMANGAGAVFADPHDPLAAADWIAVRASAANINSSERGAGLYVAEFQKTRGRGERSLIASA